MNQELQQELTDIGAELLNHESLQQESYLVPKDYFERTNVELLHCSKPKSMGYTVPKQYFTDLSARITKNTSKKAEPKKHNLWFQPIAVAAASLAFVLLSMFFMQQSSQPSAYAMQTNDFSQDLLQSYTAEEMKLMQSPYDYLYEDLEQELFEQAENDIEILDPIFTPSEGHQEFFDSLFLDV